jgi:hypothetical protein
MVTTIFPQFFRSFCIPYCTPLLSRDKQPLLSRGTRATIMMSPMTSHSRDTIMMSRMTSHSFISQTLTQHDVTLLYDTTHYSARSAAPVTSQWDIQNALHLFRLLFPLHNFFQYSCLRQTRFYFSLHSFFTQSLCLITQQMTHSFMSSWESLVIH